MGGFISKITDDVLGLDPNGGGIYDVPVIGDIVDDQLGFDPNESPIQHLLTLAGWVGAGYAGSQLYNHIAGGGAVTDLLPNWASLSGADKAAIAADAGTTAGALDASTAVATAATDAAATPGVLETISGAVAPVADIASVAAPVAGLLGGGEGVGDNSGPTGIAGFLDDTLGLDPSGGGVFDPVTGVLNPESDINIVSDALTGKPVVDAIGDILGYDDAGNPVYAGAGGFDTGLIPDASPYVAQQQELANLQQDRIKSILAGDDATTQALATRAATAAGSPFAGAGTFGGARHAQAANTAAARQIQQAQQQALSQIPTAVNTATVPYDTGIAGFKNEASRHLIDRYGDQAFDPNFLSSGNVGQTATQQQGGLLGDLNQFAQTAESLQNVIGRFNKGGKVDKDWF